jgi:spore coat protein U-like protein
MQKGVAMTRVAAVVLCAGLGLLGAATAGAATCVLAAVGVVFGNYGTLSNTALDGTGVVTVTCLLTDSYTITLSSGNGTLLQREMLSGTNVLNYNLYTDTARTLIWGDGTSGTSIVSGSGTLATYSIYGLIPGGQNVPAGIYSDSLVVTLNF